MHILIPFFSTAKMLSAEKQSELSVDFISWLKSFSFPCKTCFPCFSADEEETYFSSNAIMHVWHGRGQIFYHTKGIFNLFYPEQKLSLHAPYPTPLLVSQADPLAWDMMLQQCWQRQQQQGPEEQEQEHRMELGRRLVLEVHQELGQEDLWL